MELLYVLLVLLLITRVFGEVAVRIGQPALLGELLAGLVVGMIVHRYAELFPQFVGLTDDEVFLAITDLGVFFLMLLAGMEMRPGQIVERSGGAVMVALGGLVVPGLLGAGLALWFLPASDRLGAQALFLGTAMAVTAVPVAVKVLLDMGRLQTEPGKMIVSAAIVDDILSLILLAVLTALVQQGQAPTATGLLLLGGKVLLFFALTTFTGLWILPRLGTLITRLQAEELELSGLLVVGLGFAVLAELLGMHFIIGAFAAGLFFSRRVIEERVYDDVEKKVEGVTTGFLAPMFFVSIGMHLDLAALRAVPGFVALLIVTAVLGKLVGAGLPARWNGLSRWQAVHVGIGMSSRGAVELIIADIAMRAGLFAQPDVPVVRHMFSAVVIMALVTTLFTPVGLKLAPSPDADGA